PGPRRVPATGPRPPAATAAAARSDEAAAPRTSTPADREPRARSPYQPIEPQTENHRIVSLHFHRARNILAKVSAGMQAEVKDAYWKIFDTGDLSTLPGPRLVEIIDARISE